MSTNEILKFDLSKPLFSTVLLLKRHENPVYIFDGKIPENISQFCFPIKESKSSYFVFRCLIEEHDNSKNYYNCFCLLDQIANQEHEEICICIVSQYYYYEVFQRILEYVQSYLAKQSFEKTQKFIDLLYKNISVFVNGMIFNNLLDPRFHIDIFLDKIYETISDTFSVKVIGQLIYYLFCDLSFLVISSDISEVSKFCYGLIALLHPIRWDFIFSPILPESLIIITQSPSPYICGVHSSYSNKITSDQNTSCDIQIDLDTKTIKQSVKCHPLVGDIFNSDKKLKLCQVKQLIAKLICKTLNVLPSSIPTITARNLRTGFQSIDKKSGDSLELFYKGKTLKCLLDAINTGEIPAEYNDFLSVKTDKGLTLPCAQTISDFPFNKYIKSDSLFEGLAGDE